MTTDHFATSNTIALAALLVAAILVLAGHRAEGGAMATGAFALLQHQPAPPKPESQT
jgi:hypothetical protein